MNKLKLILSMLVLLVIAAGCGNSSSTNSDENDSNGTAETEDVTINFHHWYDTEDERLDVVIDKFEEENPGITVESIRLDPAGSVESMQALDLLAASGDKLDVVMINEGTGYAQRVGMGLLESLNPYLEENGIDPNEEFTVDLSLEGEHYALPGKYSPSITIINKDLLDEAGLPLPEDWTFDEFMEYADLLSEGEGVDKQYGTYFIDMFPNTYRMALDNQPGSNLLITEDGKSNIQHEGIRKSLEILEQAEADESVLSYSDRVSQSLHYAWPYFNQKAAMNVIGGYMISRVGGYAAYPATFTTAFAPYPKNNEADETYTPFETDYIAMAKNSEHKEESFKFIHYLATEGILEQGKYLSSWAQADVDQMVDNIMNEVESPEFVDADSLKHVVEVSQPVQAIPPTYYNELVNAYTEQVELLLLGQQDIDTTIENADQEVSRIIELNQ